MLTKFDPGFPVKRIKIWLITLTSMGKKFGLYSKLFWRIVCPKAGKAKIRGLVRRKADSTHVRLPTSIHTKAFGLSCSDWLKCKYFSTPLILDECVPWLLYVGFMFNFTLQYTKVPCCQMIVTTHVRLSFPIEYRSGVFWQLILTIYVEAQEPLSIGQSCHYWSYLSTPAQHSRLKSNPKN